MDNSLRLLGIAKKAGLLAVGDESVLTAARDGKAKAIFSANDASEPSKRRARRYAEEHGGVYAELRFSKAELGAIVGRGLPGTLAVLDIGLAAGFMRKLAEDSPAVYGDAAERLAVKAERAARRKKNAPTARKTAGAGKRRTAQ